MENLENLEGKKTDNLEDTSASVSAPVEGEGGEVVGENEKVDLTTTPVPTQEEVKDANVEPVNDDASISAPATDPAPVASDQPVEGENVNPVVEGEGQPAPVQPQVQEENGVTDMPIKSFSQDEVNEIVGKTRVDTRAKTYEYIYNRYGVKDEAGLDELVGNAQRFDSMKEQYEGDKRAWKESTDASNKELSEIKEKVALMESGIDSSRYEDAKLILKGKGLEVTPENIKSELATHSEWIKKDAEQANPDFVKTGEPVANPEPAEPETKLSVLGNDESSGAIDDEEARAMKMFKI